MTTWEDGGERIPDELTDVGIRIRLQRLEESNRRLEQKLDRLLLAFVASAIGYAFSVWAGLGGPSG